MVENALHLHATSGMGDAKHRAGNQALLGRWTVSGANQTPVGLVLGPFYQLHRLTSAYSQLWSITGHEVVDDHRQLWTTGQLWRKA